MAEKEKSKKSSEFSRIEIAYHGKRTDARDRSSEDPIRHTLPRANLSTPPIQQVPKQNSNSDEENNSDKSSTKKRRSFRSKRSKSKEKERRASRERELERSRGKDPPKSLESTSSSASSPPVSMPTTVEMTFEVLRPGIGYASKSEDENSPVPKKKSSTFQFWRDQQLKKAEAKQAQLEASAEARKSDNNVTLSSLPVKSPKPERVVVKDGASATSDKKFGRSSSLSALFSAFSRKKSSQKTDRKFSTDILVKSSPLSPDFHASIMQGTEESSQPESLIQEVPEESPEMPRTSKSPLQAWRMYRQKTHPEHFREIPPTVPELSNESSEAEPITLNLVSPPNETHRPQTADPEIPTPDYDQMSVASSGASSFMSARYFYNRATDSSMEELRPQGPHYYGYNFSAASRGSATATPPIRSSSQFNIPRYAIKSRTRSLLSASPRLEHIGGCGGSSRSPSTDSIFGGGSRMGGGSNFGSNDSQIWYQNYQTDSFPHNAVFGEEDFKGHSVDGRIHHIKGETYTQLKFDFLVFRLNKVETRFPLVHISVIS